MKKVLLFGLLAAFCGCNSMNDGKMDDKRPTPKPRERSCKSCTNCGRSGCCGGC